jgi:cell division protein FtsI/penicillin-binding protein 2
MKRAAIFALAVALVLPLWGDAGGNARGSLFAQSTSAMFAREFADPAISYLLLDARTGATLAARWDNVNDPIPVGSLVKPFTAIAYADSHRAGFPRHECLGGSTCWLPKGHGQLDFEHAVAFSCNAYFRALAADVDAASLVRTMHQFGLTPPVGATPDQLIGLDPSWTISPLALAEAYLQLARHPSDPAAKQVLAGMTQSARAGTGIAIGKALRQESALAKTGTAACTHGNAPGDGFVIALLPADAPSLLLMVRVHGVPGSRAAVTAGQMLHRLEQQTELARE